MTKTEITNGIRTEKRAVKVYTEVYIGSYHPEVREWLKTQIIAAKREVTLLQSRLDAEDYDNEQEAKK